MPDTLELAPDSRPIGRVSCHLTPDQAGLPFTSAWHEAATVATADAYFRATGRITAATTKYGAGFTNTLTALAEARLARVPLVLSAERPKNDGF